jgi:hypothetical protein
MTTKLAVTRGTPWLSSALAMVLAAGCGMAEGDEMPLDDEAGVDQGNPDPSIDDEPGIGDIEQGLTAGGGVNFEGYATGPVASPWQISRTLSTSATVERTSDHGNVFLLKGVATEWQWLMAKLAISVSTDISATVDIKPDSGAGFVWTVFGTGVSNYKRRIRLERFPGTNTLTASASPSGDVDCGPLPSNQWSRVTLVIRTGTTPSSYDVLINGNRTSCTNLRAYVTKPFNMVEIMDSANDRWGGTVRFDNISLARP